IPVDDLRLMVGSLAPWLQQLSHGIDDRKVEPNRETKSASSENTFDRDLTDLSQIREEVDRMARDVARWLSRKERLARTVTIKVRYDDFTTITRSLTVLPPTSDEASIASRAVSLLDRTEAGSRPIRLLGVGVHNLTLLGDEPERPTRQRMIPSLPFDE